MEQAENFLQTRKLNNALCQYEINYNEEKRICNAVYIVQFKNSTLKNVDFT